MFRPRVAFDAPMILSEIIALQFCFYAVYVGVTALCDFMGSIPFSNQQILNAGAFTFWSNFGRFACIGHFMAGLVVALLFTFLEGRSRKAIDFIGTTFLLHLVIVIFSSSFPASFCWWICYCGTLISSIALAIWSSSRIEMRDISLDVGLLPKSGRK